MPSIFRALQEDVVWHCVLFAFLLASPSIRSRSMWYIPNPLAPGSRMKGHIHPIIKYIWWEKERRLAVNDIFMDGCNSGCVFQYLNKHYKFRWRQLFSGSNKKWNELWGGFNAQRVWCRLIGICWGHRDGGGGVNREVFWSATHLQISLRSPLLMYEDITEGWQGWSKKYWAPSQRELF